MSDANCRSHGSRVLWVGYAYAVVFLFVYVYGWDLRANANGGVIRAAHHRAEIEILWGSFFFFYIRGRDGAVFPLAGCDMIDGAV